MTLHTSYFQGGPAFSSFKTRRLLSRLQAVCPAVQSLQTAFVYLLATDKAVNAAESARLAQLLDALADNAKPLSPPDTFTVVVSPRQGTVSPWASKAGDIARNCGFKLHRLERLTEYSLHLSTAYQPTPTEVQAIHALLHDRMTESVWPDRQSANTLLQAEIGRASCRERVSSPV